MMRAVGWFLIVMTTAVTTTQAGFLVARVTRAADDVDEVIAIDTTDGEVVQTYTLPDDFAAAPQGLEWTIGGYLLADAEARSLWSVNDLFAAPSPLYSLPDASPKGMALVGERLYIIGQGAIADSVVALHAVTGSRQAAFAVPDGFNLQVDAATDGVNLWTADITSRKLVKIDPTAPSFTEVADLPGALVFAVAYDPTMGRILVVDSATLGVHAIDPDTGMSTPLFTLDVPPQTFVWSAVHTVDVTPRSVASWSSIKARFRR